MTASETVTDDFASVPPEWQSQIGIASAESDVSPSDLSAALAAQFGLGSPVDTDQAREVADQLSSRTDAPAASHAAGVIPELVADGVEWFRNADWWKRLAIGVLGVAVVGVGVYCVLEKEPGSLSVKTKIEGNVP